MAETEPNKTLSELLVGLTLKEARFCKNWLRHGNGTQAIIDAGYDVKDENSAGSMAVTMLQKPHIKEYMERALAPEMNEVTPEWIIGQLVNLTVNAKHDGAKVRAAELLGKNRRMFVDRHEIEGGSLTAEQTAQAIVGLLESFLNVPPEVAIKHLIEQIGNDAADKTS